MHSLSAKIYFKFKKCAFNTCNCIYYFQDTVGVKYCYTPELRPRDNHPIDDFVIPPTEIEPCYEEVFAGIRAILNAI